MCIRAFVLFCLGTVVESVGVASAPSVAPSDVVPTTSGRDRSAGSGTTAIAAGVGAVVLVIVAVVCVIVFLRSRGKDQLYPASDDVVSWCL